MAVPDGAAPRRAAVLGHPVAHSLSPVLHRAAYDALGLAGWRYEMHDVDTHELVPFLAALDETWAGLSLTMPLKQEALRAVDVVQPLAEAVGAVNTVLLQPGGLTVGANTDVHGLVQALREAEPRGVDGPRTRGVIVGGGATAASAIAALGELGVRRPVVAVRSLGRAGTVLRAAAAMGVEPDLVTLGTDRATGLLRDAEIVVSTVPGGASTTLAPLVADHRLDAAQVLLDVVYEGWPTPLPQQWLASGGSVAPGWLMLLHQACEQVRLMTGRQAPEAAMRAALTAAVAPA
ncbi:shikimate dehydrogenase [Actinotalea caeni]|uniref:shikimate dehydrogenase n=1 Tax=Actinotalea caeni TaxID=1348467 RepID=UPI0012E122C0|nr:shikimate dehydrogenase [Actinotalea caeni]